MVSIKEVAKECQVSVATVSKALNNHRDISEKTKARVKEVADQMSYYPNAAARSLKTNKSYSIGVLFIDEAHSGLTHEYFSSVLQAFKYQAENLGYDIIFINTNIGTRKLSYYEYCQYRNLDGVVIACIDFEKKDVIELMKSEVPVVTIDYVYNYCTAILSDNNQGMETLLRYVCENGHKRIAYIHGQDDSAVTKARLAAFYRIMNAYGNTVKAEYIKKSEYLRSDLAAEYTKELLDMRYRPTCILYSDDIALLGGMNEIKARGLKIPQDISIAGYDGSKISQLMTPKITTIKQKTIEIGQMAATQLVEQIENPLTASVGIISVQGELLQGESVRRIE